MHQKHQIHVHDCQSQLLLIPALACLCLRFRSGRRNASNQKRVENHHTRQRDKCSHRDRQHVRREPHIVRHFARLRNSGHVKNGHMFISLIRGRVSDGKVEKQTK
jgi:hypothetical protein